MKPLIFISHVHESQHLAIAIKMEISRLLLDAIEFFVSSDRSSIVGGDRWLDKVDTALSSALIVLVLCDEKAIQRPWVNFEAGSAWASKKRVVPICYGKLNPSDLPQPLGSLQALSLYKPQDIKDLVKLIAKEIGLTPPEFDAELLVEKLQNAEPKSAETEVPVRDINSSGMFEVYSSNGGFASVANMRRLKQWLQLRKKPFFSLNKIGLPKPRGILLIGAPGCGKSLIIKATAFEWNVPLIRFNLGRIYAGLLGQSEENMREGLRFIEKHAPCILWIDDLDTKMSGFEYRDSDGISSRVLGMLLTWMSENDKQIFTMANADDPYRLSPELFRKGRFDEIFYVDLPTSQTRAEILALNLAKYSLDPKKAF